MRQNDKFCLDAFAWLAWLQDEAGAAAVQRCLDDAERGRADCVTSIINLGEAFYHLVRVNRREQAESLWRMAVRRRIPVAVKEATQRRVRRAAELKSNHAIAYADAFAVATAIEFQATLLTGDPEIKPLVGKYDLKVEWLPQPRASRTAESGETQRDRLRKNRAKRRRADQSDFERNGFKPHEP